ncbi:MAG: hypothetical protein WC708_03635 [Lentisphaeria bacterium]
MKSRNLGIWVVALMVLWALASVAPAASFIVWPGQSLQTAINNAAAGDNITVMEGVYTENITISKGIDIRGETGRTVQVTGTLVISNASANVYINGLILNGDLSVTNCADVRLDNNTLWVGLSVTGSKFYLYKTTVTGGAVFTNSDWTLQGSTIGAGLTSNTSNTKIIKSTITGDCIHNDATKELTVFQSTVTEKLKLTSAKYWVCYNNIRYMEVYGGSGEVTGNAINGRNGRLNGIRLESGNAIIRNNIIGWFHEDSYGSFYECDNGIFIVSGAYKISNNFIWILGNRYKDPAASKSAVGIGIYVKSTTSTEITNNIIMSCYNEQPTGVGGGKSIIAPNTNVIVRNNNLMDGTAGGVVPVDCINTGPGFVDLLAGDYRLKADSPCLNTGLADPEYNDHDGSRNDMGMYGGHSYDPDGKTTTAPVVLSSEVSPLFIKRGGTVTIKARAGVAAE